jgi:hypothetical protein
VLLKGAFSPTSISKEEVSASSALVWNVNPRDAVSFIFDF